MSFWDYLGNRREPLTFETLQHASMVAPCVLIADPAPLNNTYTIAVTRQTAQRYGLRDLADMAKVPRGKRTFCVDNEFFVRTDGLVGMLKAYGLRYPSDIGTVETDHRHHASPQFRGRCGRRRPRHRGARLAALRGVRALTPQPAPGATPGRPWVGPCSMRRQIASPSR